MTSRQCWMLWPFSALTLWVVAMLLVGCTFTVPLDTTLDPPTEGAQVPIAVGIYYSAEFRAYEYVSSHVGDRWVFPLGPASVTLFDQVFPRVFASTRAVQSRPPLPTGDGALAAVIEPKIEAFDHSMAAFIGGTVTVEITYRFTLYSPKGDPIASWLVKGVGAKFARIDKVASLALRDAGTKFLTGFREVPEIQPWLRQGKAAGVGRVPWRLHALFERG